MSTRKNMLDVLAEVQKLQSEAAGKLYFCVSTLSDERDEISIFVYINKEGSGEATSTFYLHQFYSKQMNGSVLRSLKNKVSELLSDGKS